MLENGYWRFGTELLASRVDYPGFVFIPFSTGACMYLYVSILKDSPALVRKVATLLKTDYAQLMNTEKTKYLKRQEKA